MQPELDNIQNSEAVKSTISNLNYLLLTRFQNIRSIDFLSDHHSSITVFSPRQ